MRSIPVVESKVREKSTVEIIAVIINVQVNMLVLDRAPQPLDENIVDGPSPAIHADLYGMVFQTVDIHIGGELAALIRVDDLWFSILGNGLFNGLYAPLGGHGITQAPSHHIARMHVYDGEQLHEAPCHGDVGDVDGPHLIG